MIDLEKTSNVLQEGKERESWGSIFGFVMATAGFVIGLGNIWRLPYKVGMNGGGAFLLVYIVICAVICVPLFMAEVSLGRKTQLNPVSGMRKITKKGSFVYDTTSSNIRINRTRGLKDGVEKACKIMMPALFIMLILLAIRSITLPGAIEGLKWYFTPDFSKINGSTVLAALGQAFFSVGIGMAAAFTYGSYLNPKNSAVPIDGILVVIFDTLIAIVAGLVIFPALFAFKMVPDAGPGLIFLTMPKLFSQLPGGNLVGGIFFLLLILASLSTGVGYIESLSSTTSELCNINRKKAVWATIAVILILGIPSVLSQGPWANILVFGKNFFDLTDYISGNILLTAGALLLSLYTAYVWKFENFMEETNIGSSGFKIAKWWKPIVCYLIPVAVAIILITGVF